MTRNMKIKYPFYISENPFIYSLFHTAGFVSHTVKYVSHSVVFVSHTVKQRIRLSIYDFISLCFKQFTYRNRKISSVPDSASCEVSSGTARKRATCNRWRP